jgi:FkbM family methyltransferase
MFIKQLKPRSWIYVLKKLKSLVLTVPLFCRLHMLGVNLTKFKDLERKSQFLKLYPGRMSEKDFLNYLVYSQSEIDQELIAFLLVGPEGYFVEFGACDGIFASNTYFLEKTQGWRGVLSEPNPQYYQDLKSHRTAKQYPFAVTAQRQGKVEFIVTNQPGLSTIKGYEKSDRHHSLRADGILHEVDTTTLRDLLYLADSPKQIDYLSIDTEGSELDILSTFPFDEFTFRFISIEHNDSENCEKLKNLMNSKGYCEILPEFSGGECWFTPRD